MKSLHLGHVAKSYALRKAPSNVHSMAFRGHKAKVKGRKVEGGHPRLKFDFDGEKQK